MDQPQWPRNIPVRKYVYTHTQPQWSDATPVAFRCPLEPTRTCASCGKEKKLCTCRTCFCCQDDLGLRSVRKHHCRKCWHAVCSSCWKRERFIHMLGQPAKVCDTCAVPRGISFLSVRNGPTLLWGLYILQRAVEMPMVCITPTCKALSYRTACRSCGLPTVTTQLHHERQIRLSARCVSRAADLVRYLESEENLARTAAVNSYTVKDVENLFGLCFSRFREPPALHGITSTMETQDILLSMLSAMVAYEYAVAPSLTLALSDVSYSRLLKLNCSTSRYSIFEAPGKVKYVSFPGTHNFRTFAVDLRCGRVKREKWSCLVDGIVNSSVSNGSGGHTSVCGGVRKKWEYLIHKGFACEVEEIFFYVEHLLHDVLNHGYRLVFSGHSLGGAVAKLITLHMLEAHPELKEKLTCVTFGAPLVGNYQLAEWVERCGWRSRFHNFIYRSDIIPRLLCADQLTRDYVEQFFDRLTTVHTSLYRWLTTSASVTEGQQEILARVDTKIREGKALLEDENTSFPTGGRLSHRMYACFGWYHFLSYSNVDYFSTDDSEVAFHWLKQGCGGEKRIGDHSIANYNRALTLCLYTH